jgi:hypothetical protein
MVAPFQLRPKKKYSRLSVVMPFQLQPEKKIQSSGHIIRCAIPIAMVAPFQLPPEKKIQSSVRCYPIPITTKKKKDTVVWPSFVAPFQLPSLRRSN